MIIDRSKIEYQTKVKEWNDFLESENLVVTSYFDEIIYLKTPREVSFLWWKWTVYDTTTKLVELPILGNVYVAHSSYSQYKDIIDKIVTIHHKLFGWREQLILSLTKD